MHHLETLAQTCTDLAPAPRLRAAGGAAWVAGEILDEPHDLEPVTVALVVASG